MKSKSSRFRVLRFGVPAVAVFAVAALVLAACGGGGDDEEPEATTTTTTEAPPPVAPLTGLPDPGGEASTRAALWVKVGNNPDGARPQTGLELADVVYEEVAEGGVTRFAAVFNSVVPERVGPVRSVRPMDVDLVQPLLGIFAYSGGAPGPTNMIESVDGLLTVDETAAGGEAMVRSPDRGMPNNLYVVGPEMFARGGDPKPPPALFVYRDSADSEGDDDSVEDEDSTENTGDEESTDGEAITDDEALSELVDSFVVGFSFEPVTWRWDVATGGWLRFLGENPFTTIEGNQISATNVIVQFIHYPNDSEGITIGEGQAWVFTGGEVIRGTWQRDDARSPIRYLDADGEDIRLTPGRTWVQLLPNAGTVDVFPAAPEAATP